MISLIAASIAAAAPAAAQPAPPANAHAQHAQHQQAAPQSGNAQSHAKMDGCCCCKDMAGKMQSGVAAKSDQQDHKGH